MRFFQLRVFLTLGVVFGFCLVNVAFLATEKPQGMGVGDILGLTLAQGQLQASEARNKYALKNIDVQKETIYQILHVIQHSQDTEFDQSKISNLFTDLPRERHYVQKILKERGGKITKINLLTILERQLDDLEAKSVPTHGAIGRAAWKGLGGKSAQYIFSDIIPTTFIEGVGAAIVYRTMMAVGDKFEATIRQHGGDIWDTVAGNTLRRLKNAFLGRWYWLFSGGIRPYSIETINQWQKEVNSVIIANLDRQAKTAQSDQGSGFSTRARAQHKLDSIMLDDLPGGVTDQVQADPTWLAMTDGLGRDLDRLTRRIEIPKRYYSAASDEDEDRMLVDGRADILDLATRLQETLQLIKEHILLPTRSLKDLAVGDLKYHLPRLKDEVSHRFDLFKIAVNNYHGGSSKIQNNSYDGGKPSRDEVAGGDPMYLDR